MGCKVFVIVCFFSHVSTSGYIVNFFVGIIILTYYLNDTACAIPHEFTEDRNVSSTDNCCVKKTQHHRMDSYIHVYKYQSGCVCLRISLGFLNFLY